MGELLAILALAGLCALWAVLQLGLRRTGQAPETLDAGQRRSAAMTVCPGCSRCCGEPQAENRERFPDQIGGPAGFANLSSLGATGRQPPPTR